MLNKRIIKILVLVAMVCFFLPFITVSCSGDSITATGVELMTTVSFRDEIKEVFEEHSTPNYVLAIAFVLGVVSLVLTHSSSEENRRLLGAGGCSIGSAIFLIIFRTGFFRFYELNGYEDYLHVEYRAGWILSLIAFICAAGCAFIVALKTDLPATKGAAQPAEKEMRSCQSCGAPVKQANRFCPRCGAPQDESGERTIAAAPLKGTIKLESPWPSAVAQGQENGPEKHICPYCGAEIGRELKGSLAVCPNCGQTINRR